MSLDVGAILSCNVVIHMDSVSCSLVSLLFCSLILVIEFKILPSTYIHETLYEQCTLHVLNDVHKSIDLYIIVKLLLMLNVAMLPL